MMDKAYVDTVRLMYIFEASLSISKPPKRGHVLTIDINSLKPGAAPSGYAPTSTPSPVC